MQLANFQKSTAPKMALELKNPHSLDCRIVAIQEPHLYFIDGNCDGIISSTTFVHSFFPEFDSQEASQKILESKSFKETSHRPSHKYNGCTTKEDILEKWNKWRDLGTELHDNIEKFLNDEKIEPCRENKEPFEKFLIIYRDHHFWKWKSYRTEWAIFDEEFRIAGKLDFVGIDKNGHLVILDWKRVGMITDSCIGRFQGKKPVMGLEECRDLENCKFVTYSLQLNVYKYIIEKNYGFKVSKMFLIQVHPSVKQPSIYKVADLQDKIKRMLRSKKFLK